MGTGAGFDAVAIGVERHGCVDFPQRYAAHDRHAVLDTYQLAVAGKAGIQGRAQASSGAMASFTERLP